MVAEQEAQQADMRWRHSNPDGGERKRVNERDMLQEMGTTIPKVSLAEFNEMARRDNR